MSKDNITPRDCPICGGSARGAPHYCNTNRYHDLDTTYTHLRDEILNYANINLKHRDKYTLGMAFGRIHVEHIVKASFCFMGDIVHLLERYREALNDESTKGSS